MKARERRRKVLGLVHGFHPCRHNMQHPFAADPDCSLSGLTEMLNTATAQNIVRKSAYADHLQLRGGEPVFSWLDLNITELCNRRCVFCPRVDERVYPNQPLHMSLGLARKIADELHDMQFTGAVVLCGFGEPLLHPALVDFVAQFGRHRLHVELVTNGDKLTSHYAYALRSAGTSFFLVSCYDGPEQMQKFRKVFEEAEVPSDAFSLRDRWHGAEEDYGLKLTNRAGTINVGNQPEIDKTHACFYPAYEMSIDWNGDVLLCVQDWNKQVRFGNVAQQSLWDVWTSTVMHKRRMRLINGKRDLAPCSSCNAEGTCHGSAHAEVWSR